MLSAFRKVSAVGQLIVVDAAAAVGLALLPVLSTLRGQAGGGVPGMPRL
ncbi:hypothetical protein [Kitasatospora griseola]